MNDMAYGTAPVPVRTDYAVAPSRFWQRLGFLGARRTGATGAAIIAAEARKVGR